MTRPAPLRVWIKTCPAKDESLWVDRLSEHSGSLAILSSPGRPSLRIQVFGLSPSRARALKSAWGGAIRSQLPPPVIQPPAPIRIRQRLVVVSDPAQLAPPPADGRAALLVPAGMAFGTGDHATTSTCLRLLADLDLSGTDFLDLGCGTGILAMAARKLGARRVLAADFDPAAVRVTRENLRINHLSGIAVRRLDVLAWKPERRWPVVAANLFSGVLIEAAPALAAATAPGGLLLFSGVLQSQSAAVCRALGRNGFRILNRVRRGKWFTALARRTEGRKNHPA